MAIVESIKSNTSDIQVAKKVYPNGPVLIVGPVGNMDPKNNILNCGAKKLSKLFQEDKDGDSILLTLYQFLDSSLTVDDLNLVKSGIRRFIDMYCKDQDIN